MSKYPSRAKRLQEAMAKAEEAKTDVEALQSEIDDWKSNMEGTNLESTQKYQDLEECCDALDTVMESLDDAISNADDVNFPGMFG